MHVTYFSFDLFPCLSVPESSSFLLILAAMGFGDLQSRDGLLVLNTFLGDKSYIEGSVARLARSDVHASRHLDTYHRKVI